MRNDVFVVHDRGDSVTRFDRAGRWFFASRGGTSYRRGSDGRIRVQARFSRIGRAERLVRWLEGDEARKFCREISAYVEATRGEVVAGRKRAIREVETVALHDELDKILAWDLDQLDKHASRFREIYGSVPVLPPDQYFSLYLQPVVGCSYNQCSFCSFYRDRSFHRRNEAEWTDHLLDVRRFFGDGISLRRNIFLGDANALTISNKDLAGLWNSIRTVFPESEPGGNLAGVYTFMDTFSSVNRRSEDYAALGSLGLKRIYLGIESGSDAVRNLVEKPGGVDMVVRVVNAIKRGGVSVGLMVMTGIGGREHSDEHVAETLEFLDRCEFDGNDVLFISPLSAAAGAEYTSFLTARGLTPMGRDELELEEKRIRSGRPAGMKVATYDVEGFVY